MSLIRLPATKPASAAQHNTGTFPSLIFDWRFRAGNAGGKSADRILPTNRLI
jgi:hypothetical protein